MTDEQKAFIGSILQEKFATATALQIVNFLLLSKNNQNTMLSNWIAARRAAAVTGKAAVDGQATQSKSDFDTIISMCDSITNPL